MRHRWLAPSWMLLPLALSACAGAEGPATPSGTGITAPPLVQTTVGGATQQAMLQATLTVDASALHASLDPITTRSASANDQLAFLDLGAFFTSATMQVKAVNHGQSTLDVTLQISHPFAGPDLTQPASATNRADLGFAGRLLVLAEVPTAERASHTFFGGQVRADTSLVANPDGYVEPRGLVPTEGFANTFPYLLLVDEDRDNRIGVSNDGIPRGNYLPGVGGWQRLNLGPDHNGWTGYGYLHQGQAAELVLKLHRDALAAGPVAVPLVLLGKYLQPKGGANPRENRLPPVVSNPDRFAYRMPYGAIDAERIESAGPVRLVAGDPNIAGAVEVEVRDWDARAAITAHPSLALETDVGKIQPGGDGAPAVLLDAPTLRPNGPLTLSELNPGARSGLPGAEIRYRGNLRNESGRPAGTYWALAQVIDPETIDAARYEQPYQTDLTRDQQPITDPALRFDPITYQAIPITVVPRSDAPTCNECHLSTGRFIATRPPTVNLSSLRDDSPAVTLEFRYEGPSEEASSALTLATELWGGESNFSPWSDARLTSPLALPTLPGTYRFQITADDGDQRVEFPTLFFTLTPPGSCPTVGTFDGSSISQPPGFASRDDLAQQLAEEFQEPVAAPLLTLAGYRDRAGWLLTQGASGTFYRYAPATGELQPVTEGYPGSGWEHRALLLDLDHQGYGIWVGSNINQTKEPDPSLATIYANAGSVVHVFDASGVTPVSTELTSFDVGKPIVAMCVDEDDSIWIVDSSNALRRFMHVGPEYDTYIEDDSSGILLGAASAGGILGPMVYDIDLDYHNRAFFVVVRQITQRLAVWRIECDGNLQQPNGHTNPLDDVAGLEITDAAIAIDNYGSAGQVLTGQQDAQILVAVENGTGWLGVLTSDMLRTTQAHGTQGASRLALLYREDQAITLADQSGPAGSRLLDTWMLPESWR